MKKQDRIKVLNSLEKLLKNKYPEFEINRNNFISSVGYLDRIEITGFRNKMITGDMLDQLIKIAKDIHLYNYVSIVGNELSFIIH